MQPFDGITASPNPQRQAEPHQGQPEDKYAPQYPQQYPQSQQISYPTLPQIPYPQNYEAPCLNQPGGYPTYQSQPQYAMYNQAANQPKNDAQKIIIAQPLSQGLKSSGKSLVAMYYLFILVASFGITYVFVNQTSYQILLNAYQRIVGHSFSPFNALSQDSCQAFLSCIITVPLFLFIFAGFNFLAMLVSLTGLSCCMFIQGFYTLFWACIAVFVSQQKCVGYSVLPSMFGANNVPQNAWPYYAGMAIASLVACFLNWNWSRNKEAAEKDQKNVALMVAAS